MLYVVSIEGFPYSANAGGGEVYLLIASNKTEGLRNGCLRFLKDRVDKSVAKSDSWKISKDLRKNKTNNLFLVIIEGFKGTRSKRGILRNYLIDEKTTLSAQRKMQMYFMKKYPEHAIAYTQVIEITKDITGQNPSRRI